MNKTKIEWVKNPDGSQGFTSNPIQGKCPIGCPYCYVNPIRKRYGWPEEISWNPRECGKWITRNKPSSIFVGSTHEIFWEGYHQWTCDILQAIRICEQHRFYLLTKQPQNLQKFSPFPDNCWVGVSATNTAQFGLACYYLVDVKASLKYISFEPLLGSVAEPAKYIGGLHQSFLASGIKWVIIGAQTKPYKPPKIEWVREIVEACDKAGIPVFLKDNLRSLIYGKVWACRTGAELSARGHMVYPSGALFLRQELPSAKS